MELLKMMMMSSIWGVVVCFLMSVKWVLKRANWWLYERKLGEKQNSLPPGDLGWPLIGNMWSFLKAFKSSNPESFMESYAKRYGRTGIYKAFMFGEPSVIVTKPETCRRVLMDDDGFKAGWPIATMKLMGEKSFIRTDISIEEHKRLRRLTAASINGHEALSAYLEYIEESVKSALDKWAKMGQIEFLTQLRKLTFRIIMCIFLSSESEHIMDALEREYTAFNYGIRAMAINIPGFAYNKALKARKNIVAVLQSILAERRNQRKDKNNLQKKKDMMDALLDVEDENGSKMEDEEIIDIFVMYLNAGHESSGHTMMWATILLQQHPEFLQKAKEEQERIVKKRPSAQKGLSLKEIRGMTYLDKVIDETLRVVTISVNVFREGKEDINLNGYMIPKGWKVLVWFRSVHFDPEIYPNPKEFNPERWEGYTAKAGSFLPFGAGSRLCPGNDLAKLEVAVFLHHFLMNYRLERLNPRSSLIYLPHSRPKDNCLARVRKSSSAMLKICEVK